MLVAQYSEAAYFNLLTHNYRMAGCLSGTARLLYVSGLSVRTFDLLAPIGRSDNPKPVDQPDPSSIDQGVTP